MDLSAILSSVSASVLAILANLQPVFKNAGQVESVIVLLEQIIPFAATIATDLIQPIENEISLLKGSDALTPEQVAALDSLSEQVDAAYNGAWDAYKAAHPDPATSGA